jgi:hypothetical protein
LSINQPDITVLHVHLGVKKEGFVNRLPIYKRTGEDDAKYIWNHEACRNIFRTGYLAASTSITKLRFAHA